MEKSKKHVDRQATFDTDARTKKDNLKLPVIDPKSPDQSKRKPLTAAQNLKVDKTKENGIKDSHLGKNGHISNVNQNKGLSKASNSGKTEAPAQKTLNNETRDGIGSKSTTRSSSKENQKSVQSNVGSSNNSIKNTGVATNAAKSTPPSKSLEAKLVKKDAQEDNSTGAKGQRKDESKRETQQSVNHKGKEPQTNAKVSENQDKQTKTSVLSKVNRNRSKSPEKEISSPDKGRENHKNNERFANKNVFKPAQIQNGPKSQNVDKTQSEKQVQHNKSKLDTPESKGSVSPRRIKLSSKASSESGHEDSVPSSSTLSETKYRNRSTALTKTKESNTTNSSVNKTSKLDIPEDTSKSKSSPLPPQKSPRNTVKPLNTPDSVNDTKRAQQDVHISGGKATLSLTDNHKDTYVLSPAATKLDSKSAGNKFQIGRLSPTNETVEPLKLEPRQGFEKNRMDGKETYEQVYAERLTLLKAEHAYRKRIKQLEDEANGFLKAIEELTNENRYLRDKSEDDDGAMRVQGKGGHVPNEQIAALEKENANLLSRVKHLEQEAKTSVTQDELTEMKEQVIKLQSENQRLNEENKDLRSRDDENVRQIRALESDNTSLKTSATASESSKMDQLQDLKREREELNKRFRESERKAKDLEKKVDALEYENKTLSESLASKKAELKEILGVMKDENKFDNEIKDLKNQVLKLEKEKKDVELSKNKEKRVINEKLNETKASLEKLTGELDELKIKYDQVEKEKKKLKAELTPLKKKAEVLESECETLKGDIEKLQKQLKDANQKYAKLISESEDATEDLKGTKNQLEKFNKELQTIVNDKESQISKLINQLDSMREERDTDRKTIKEEKEKVAKEMETIEQYQTTNRRLETDIKQFAELLDESRLKEKQLALQLEDKDFQMSNLEQQVFEMNVKLDNNSKRMGDLDREKREMERDKRDWDVKKDKLDDIEASNKRLLEENKRLRNQLDTNSYILSGARPTDRTQDDKGVMEAWVHENAQQKGQTAIYVTKDRDKKRVHIVQPDTEKKRQPFTKLGAGKQKQTRKTGNKSKSPSRSLEDIRKMADIHTPESEHSLPELDREPRLTVRYGAFAGYREIHKDRIKAAQKKVY